LTFNKQYRQNLPKFDYNPDQLLHQYYEDFGGALLKAFDLLGDMGLVDSKIFIKTKVLKLKIGHKKKRCVVDCSNGVLEVSIKKD
jgi:hypothetical protein